MIRQLLLTMSHSSTPSLPHCNAGPATDDRPQPTVPDLGETAPHIVTVMCPVGFTPYATEGLTLDKPLFARVTYRRVRSGHRR